MKPAEAIIAEARADGVTLDLTPEGQVVFKGSRAATERWLPILRGAKPALAAYLRRQSDGSNWSAADWRAHYDERAGMLEYDGGLSRTEAEARAREWVTAEYMVRAHKPTVPGICAHCGAAGHEQAVIPHGTVTAGHVWLHSRCWRVWYDRQVQGAREALGVMGVFDRDGSTADGQD